MVADSVTVSAKIPRKLKERLAKHGVRVSEIMPTALEEVAKREEMELQAALRQLSREQKARFLLGM